MNVSRTQRMFATSNFDAIENDNDGDFVDDTAIVKAFIAGRNNVPAYIIARQLECVNKEVLKRVAEDPQTDARTLSVLAHCDNEEIREAVADNPNAPFSTLLRLARDINPDVRFQVAENPKIPGLILEILADDENPYIQWRAEVTLHKIH